MFVHHVFFWLNEGLTSEEVSQFEAGVKSLLAIEHVHFGEIGTPASTNRPVIERSYGYSLLLVFKDQEAHDQYQPHAIHQAFVASCAHLWSKVLIYDSESIV